MIKRLKASLEAKDALTRKPYGFRVIQPGRFLTTGGTNWSAKDSTPTGHERMLHMSTEQFTEHLGPREEHPI